MNSKTILIVDDEPFLRSTLAMILKRVGYSIQEAANAQEALRALNGCEFDLIFLDLKMPGRDGLDLLPEITSGHPDTPILVLTADGSLEKAIEALRIGARDYLLKPVDPGQIIIRVDDLLREGNQPIHSISGEDEASDSGYITRKDHADDAGCYSKVHPEAFFDQGPFHMDLLNKTAFLYGEPLEMDYCTFEYLVTLLNHTPHPVPYESLVFESQGYTLTPSEAQDVCRWRIHRLRKIIEIEPQEPQFIINVPGIGYRLIIG